MSRTWLKFTRAKLGGLVHNSQTTSHEIERSERKEGIIHEHKAKILEKKLQSACNPRQGWWLKFLTWWWPEANSQGNAGSFRTLFVCEWPRQSPDLNAIKHLWRGMKMDIHWHFPSYHIKSARNIGKKNNQIVIVHICVHLFAWYVVHVSACVSSMHACVYVCYLTGFLQQLRPLPCGHCLQYSCCRGNTDQEKQHETI